MVHPTQIFPQVIVKYYLQWIWWATKQHHCCTSWHLRCSLYDVINVLLSRSTSLFFWIIWNQLAFFFFFWKCSRGDGLCLAPHTWVALKDTFDPCQRKFCLAAFLLLLINVAHVFMSAVVGVKICFFKIFLFDVAVLHFCCCRWSLWD